jgi:hypothetical protein
VSPTHDFDYLCDLLAFACSLPRDEAFAELREASMQLAPGSPLRSWFLRETAELLGVHTGVRFANARQEVRA